MTSNEKHPNSHGDPSGQRRRLKTAACGRSVGLVVLAAAAVSLSACSSPSTPHVASVATSSANATSPATRGSGDRPTTSPKAGDPTQLVNEWAACMRKHGDPNQADPVIDSHGVINITISTDVHNQSRAVVGGTEGQPQSVPCSEDLNAAQRALRAEFPVAPPPSQAEYLKYVGCMRTHGVPNYPDPTGDTTNFNGTGVDLNSPTFIAANKVCGNQVNAPAWWTNGWGPPGDVSVSSGPNGGPAPGVARPVTGRSGGAGTNG